MVLDIRQIEYYTNMVISFRYSGGFNVPKN
jgi:hypothetical protein